MQIIKLVEEIRQCELCSSYLPLPAKPILQAGQQARILIAGQAPGIKAHEAGEPFRDPSGDRLREWMGINEACFYNPAKVAIVPMGFCYPGKGKSGDSPPRPECSKQWREAVLTNLPDIQLTLVIGRYAQAWHLPELGNSVTETVSRWQETSPEIFPLPHPSPRNLRWFKQHPWFTEKVIPALRKSVTDIFPHT